jgi:hypothetical protein
MIENNRALSAARASGVVIFRSRDYGPKAPPVNDALQLVATTPSPVRTDSPRASTAGVDNFVGNPARRIAEP